MSIRSLRIQEKDGSATEIDVDLVRCYNLGFTMRDEAKMQAHLEECYKLGV